MVISFQLRIWKLLKDPAHICAFLCLDWQGRFALNIILGPAGKLLSRISWNVTLHCLQMLKPACRWPRNSVHVSSLHTNSINQKQAWRVIYFADSHIGIGCYCWHEKKAKMKGQFIFLGFLQSSRCFLCKSNIKAACYICIVSYGLKKNKCCFNNYTSNHEYILL